MSSPVNAPPVTRHVDAPTDSLMSRTLSPKVRVFTGGRARVAARLEAGTVNVDDASAAAWGSMDAPMGGMKASGLGRCHGEHDILKYAESQTIAIGRLLPVGVPDGMNVARYARRASGVMCLLERMPGV